jgi:tetratricopeptide (TPR) repeat protein
MRLIHLCLLTAFLCLSTTDLCADRVVVDDGRILKPKKARPQGEGYLLEFENGDIVLPDKSRLTAVEIEGDMSDYVPANEDERQKLAQGYVRYRGRWLSKPAYENELQKEFEASKARADELAAHADFHSAWTKTTKHFVVNSNTSPELLDYYCELLEAYYDLMDGRFKINPPPILRKTKMKVNIYRSRPEFYNASKHIPGISLGVAGFFDSSGQSLNFYHDYQEPAISDWVGLHECTHLLTYLIDPQYVSQIWLNEAVADFFGSSVVERDAKGRLKITPGRLQTDRTLTVQEAIRAGNDIALADLFMLKREEFQAFQYAHAWSFIYFLNQSGEKNRKAFDSFFKDIYTLAKGIEYEAVPWSGVSGHGKSIPPREIQRVVMEALKVKDLATLEKEWKDFIAAIPIEGPDARFKRAWMAIYSGKVFDPDPATRKARIAEARADLDAAIKDGIQDARAWAARSSLALFQGDEDTALADLETAIERDPLNANYRFRVGMLMVGGAISISSMDGAEKDDVIRKTFDDLPEAQPYLGLAMELAPQNPAYFEVYERYMGR